MNSTRDKDALTEIQKILANVVDDNKRLKAELELVRNKCHSLSDQLYYAIGEIEILKLRDPLKQPNTKSAADVLLISWDGDSCNLPSTSNPLPNINPLAKQSSSTANTFDSSQKVDITKGELAQILHLRSGDALLETDKRLQALAAEVRELETSFESKWQIAHHRVEQTESKLLMNLAQQASSFASTYNVQNTIIQNQLKRMESTMDTKIDEKLQVRPGTKLSKIVTKKDAKLDSKMATMQCDAREEAKIDAKIDAKLDVKMDSMMNFKIDALMTTKMDVKLGGKMDVKMATKMEANMAAMEKRLLENGKAGEKRLNNKCRQQSKEIVDKVEKFDADLKDADVRLKASKRDSILLQKDHKAVNYKLNKIEDAILKVENMSSSFKHQMTAYITEEVQVLRGVNSGILVWKINEFSRKKSDNVDTLRTILSEPFSSSEYGYRMIAHLDFSADRLGVFIEFLPIDTFGATLPPIFLHRRTFQILDQSQRADKRNIVRQQDPVFRSAMPLDWMTGNWGNPRFVTYALLEEQSDVYLRDDVLFVKVMVEPLTVAWAKTLITDGSLLWRIERYRRTQAESLQRINEFIESAPFYTAARGHRMQVRLQFTASAMNVFPDFLMGEHDQFLEDTFSHQTRFMVVDQRDPSGNGVNLIQRVSLDLATVGRDEARRKMSVVGCDGVAFPLETIERPPYLVNDTLLLKVIVDAL